MNGNTKAPLARHLQHGNNAESLAHTYLLKRGLTAITRNYRCKCGEIDLVMRDADSLVFVEVRYRASQRFGTAAETIFPDKMQRLRRTAEYFLQRHPRHAKLYSRFDVIGITGALNAPQIDWIKDAF